ncbi:Fic family protein, partial [Modestobacter sp. KNN46-3]|uniref:Fic family protein n=1 Tax=Modestobacter sp. KNN46-3 TaxID=2711218 RepID=UPI0013DE922D
LGNVRAMRAALDLAGDLSPSTILAMHAALLDEVEPTIAGRWRTDQVWIGGDSYGPHGAAFIPPVADDVPALIDDLVTFARREDVPVLVLAAVSHAQFETIHPFPDGNGRTGRALIHALLRRYELTRAVTVPVSAGLLSEVDGYFAALTAYREGDINPIVSALADGALTAVVNARQLVADLHQVRARWDDVVLARRDATAWRVADLLVRQPVLDAATIAREVGVSPGNALRALEPLVAAGVVTEFTGRARNRLWQATEVLTAVDAFAARAGRRRAG